MAHTPALIAVGAVLLLLLGRRLERGVPRCRGAARCRFAATGGALLPGGPAGDDAASVPVLQTTAPDGGGRAGSPGLGTSWAVGGGGSSGSC